MAGKIVQVAFNEKEYSYLEKQAEAEGAAIALYIKNKVLERTTYKKWFDTLVSRVSNLPEGTKFTVKLVLGTDWPTIERGDRLALGRAFYQYVQADKLPRVCSLKKDSANVQWYQVQVGGEG